MFGLFHSSLHFLTDFLCMLKANKCYETLFRVIRREECGGDDERKIDGSIGLSKPPEYQISDLPEKMAIRIPIHRYLQFAR